MTVTITLHDGQTYTHANIKRVDQDAGGIVYLHCETCAPDEGACFGYQPTQVKRIVIDA